MHTVGPPPPSPGGPGLLVQQWDLAVVTMVSAHLAVCWVEAGGVGEGRRQGVIVCVGVARWGEQGLGVRLGRVGRRVVVLVLAGGRAAAVA